MGNTLSSSPPAPPAPAPPQPVITLPLQRVPTLDGTSGLQYSGQVYTNPFQSLSKDICQGATATAAQINDVMPNSISTTTLPMDDTTKRISQTALSGYISNLVSTGKIPGQMASFNDQMAADKQFYAAIQAEYCFYESRYTAALTQFLSLATNTQGADPTATQNALAATVALNQRLNSLLEILNYVGNERARQVNGRGPKVDAANASLEKQIAALAAQQNMLMSGSDRLRTQEEMLRYSAEKSRAMNIQIMFFVALNVVALGTVLTVYKSLGPRV